MAEAKDNIRLKSQAELEQILEDMGEKAFRGRQIHEWLWKKKATSFADMSNISKGLIAKLDEQFFIPVLGTQTSQVSSDGTIKSAFRLDDGKVVEGVLIPQGKRMTACISSQVGCSLACTFCATGRMKQMRNLTADEIYDQVKTIDDQAREHYEHHLSNIVYMGMGEPLLNYREVLKSVDMITSKSGMGMSPRRITVSTAGIAKMIRKLGDDEVKFNLALSLHAANDEKRNQIMAINESNNLEALSEALVYFQEKTGRRITFEYIVFHDFNDKIEDAKELAEFCKAVACKINLIEYNPIEDTHFRNATKDNIERFSDYLLSKNLIVNIRRSRGKDIDAACGQLVIKEEET
jgi:23S rRNA (adenine2503-C2)-methyltransferase